MTSTPKKNRGEHLCAECGSNYTTHTNLMEHMRAKHSLRGEGARYSCQICDKKFMKRELYESHTNVHAGLKPYACTTCKRSYASQCNLTVHSRVCAVPPGYVCAECTKPFKSAKDLSSHLLSHDIFPKYSCPNCGTLFKHMQSLARHTKSRCLMARNDGQE